MRPAVFLDRDGVICEYVDYLHRVSDFKLRKQVGEAIKILNDNNFLVFVITNQPMIAKGLLSIKMLSEIHQKMTNELNLMGAKIDLIEYCPHSSEGNTPPWNIDCECRKPKTGMVQKIGSRYDIDFTQSFLVGDTWRDIQCAKSLSLYSFGVLGGGGYPYNNTNPHGNIMPDRIVNSLYEAVQIFLNRPLNSGE